MTCLLGFNGKTLGVRKLSATTVNKIYLTVFSLHFRAKETWTLTGYNQETGCQLPIQKTVMFHSQKILMSQPEEFCICYIQIRNGCVIKTVLCQKSKHINCWQWCSELDKCIKMLFIQHVSSVTIVYHNKNGILLLWQ